MPRTPPPRSLPPPAEARAERRARSLEEPLDVRVKAVEPYPLLEVRNPIHRTAYLVMLPEFPAPTPALCTCTDFARRDLGTCKHLEAGRRWLSSHAEALAPPIAGRSARRGPNPWAEIDRRQRELPAPARLTGRALARPGATLFEESTPGTGEKDEEGVRRGGTGAPPTPTSPARP